MAKKKRKSRAKLPREKAIAIRNANLRPAQPGEVRNPLGKNGSDWLGAFRRYWAAEASADDVAGLGKGVPRRDGDRRYEVLMRSLFRNVVRGSDQSIKLATEQLNGRARQHIEIKGDAGNGPAVQFMLPSNGRDVAPPAPDAVGADGGDEGATE